MDTKTQLAEDILNIAKANQEVYLTAYRVGYQAGWDAASKRAIEIINEPITTKELPK
jgi:hypothetical protein